MIKTEIISGNALQIIMPETIKSDDFRQLAPQVDAIIAQYGKIKLFIDASKFSGWESVEVFETHINFVKTHQEKVERIAVITGYVWQNWLVSFAKMFVHPAIRSYDRDMANEALEWVLE